MIKTNVNATDTRQFWSGPNSIFKDIGDIRQRPSISVPVLANASQKITVQVANMGTTLLSSVSDFFIEGVQFYEKV
jgi:hypothetical protein